MVSLEVVSHDWFCVVSGPRSEMASSLGSLRLELLEVGSAFILWMAYLDDRWVRWDAMCVPVSVCDLWRIFPCLWLFTFGSVHKPRDSWPTSWSSSDCRSGFGFPWSVSIQIIYTYQILPNEGFQIWYWIWSVNLSICPYLTCVYINRPSSVKRGFK